MKNKFMAEAIRLSRKMTRAGEGGPFGAVIVKNGKIIARGWNRVTSTNDPTAHAEMMAIRIACKKLKNFQLDNCVIYTSCEPCPMCLAAIYWARPKKIFYANTKKDAAKIGFDDDFIYKELKQAPAKRKMLIIPMMRNEALPVFQEWSRKKDKIRY
ncbi:MAG: nucleoside deaminase [bacterium]|nr:nucleoside deaminase [bacterium]